VEEADIEEALEIGRIVQKGAADRYVKEAGGLLKGE